MASNSKKIEIEDPEFSNKTGRYSFQDAVGLTQYGKFHVLITIATGLSLMGAVLENVSVSLILPYAKCDLQLTTSEQGLLTSVSFLGIVMSSHFWGFMADTWGRVKVIRTSLILGFICSFLSAFSFNTPMMLVLRLLVGLFVSGVQATGFSYVSGFHTKATASRAASFASIFISAIFLYLPLIAIILIPMDWSFYILALKFAPWRLYIIVSSLVNFLVFVIFRFLPETPSFLLQINENEKALEILQAMYAFNTCKSKEMFPVKEILLEPTGRSFASVKGFSNIMKLVWDQTKPIFLPPFLGNTVKLSFLIFVLFAIGHGTLMWIPDFLVQLQDNIGSGKTMCEIVSHRVTMVGLECSNDNKNMSTFQILFGVGVLFVCLQAIVSFYLNQIGPKNLITIWLILSSLSSIGIVFLTEYYVDVIAIVIFTSCSACASIMSAISVNLYTTNIRAMATCCIYMFGRLGGFFGSNLVAAMLENHCTTIFYIYAVLLIICIGVFVMIRPNTRQI